MPGNKNITIELPRSREKISLVLRTSEKARRISLRITEKGVELVRPFFVPEQEALSFLSASLSWLEKTWKKHRVTSSGRGGKKRRKEYPSQWDLAALCKKPSLLYIFSDVPWVGVKWGKEDLIHVQGNVLSAEQVKEALEQFVLREAEKFLVPLLHEISVLTGMEYKKCAIRMQNSRWGSCSSHGTISLNAMLLFVPEECVKYVLIHELCHTRHMDHSVKFWQEVAKYMPEWKYLRSLLKRFPITLWGGK